MLGLNQKVVAAIYGRFHYRYLVALVERAAWRRGCCFLGLLGDASSEFVGGGEFALVVVEGEAQEGDVGFAIAQVKIKGRSCNKANPMTVRQPRYSKEEFARRGHEIYDDQVRSQVEPDNHGKVVAIDIETGAFEVGEDSLTAAKRLLARCPESQIFGIRIGHRTVHRFGFRSPGVEAKNSIQYSTSRWSEHLPGE